jgi:hypothetical protein
MKPFVPPPRIVTDEEVEEIKRRMEESRKQDRHYSKVRYNGLGFIIVKDKKVDPETSAVLKKMREEHENRFSSIPTWEQLGFTPESQKREEDK